MRRVDVECYVCPVCDDAYDMACSRCPTCANFEYTQNMRRRIKELQKGCERASLLLSFVRPHLRLQTLADWETVEEIHNLLAKLSKGD